MVTGGTLVPSCATFTDHTTNGRPVQVVQNGMENELNPVMPATHSGAVSTENQRDEEGFPANVPTSGPAVAIPSPTSAVSMASKDDGATALHSPAEGSPARPATASPTVSGTSPAGSHVACASNSAACAVGVTKLAVAEFVRPHPNAELPNTLTCKNVRVILENDRVWKQFHSCGTEMILTKQGRRMFPYCRYRLAGLDPDRRYGLVLSIVPSDKYKYRWNSPKWEVVGPAEHQAQVPRRAFTHHNSLCRGSDLMGGMISFYKLKVTNNPQDLEGHIVLTSMHRYIPQLHVIPLPDDIRPPLVIGPESMTFTFPQTEFMAVTTYQNFLITQLKINHNPFAKGFREDRAVPRVGSGLAGILQFVMVPPEERPERKPEDERPPSPDSASPPTEPESKLVLKPITFTTTANQEPIALRMDGRQGLKDLVLTPKCPLKTSGEDDGGGDSPKKRLHIESQKTSCISSVPSVQRRSSRRGQWTRFDGGWKSPTASPASRSPPSMSITAVDEVEGLTFLSFDTREALEDHIRATAAAKTQLASPDSSLTTPTWPMETDEDIQETSEKIFRLEAILLQELKVAKHRQVIHPALQEVGLKLSSLDVSMTVDLCYLGVCLPLPPLKLPTQDRESEGLPFISRTGKTSDVTKIKGWKNKFVQSNQPSDAPQKNLSAFCSNMLDEYLESEAQQISERAAAFSASPDGAVSYQLPAKGASYVKTLDSALKHRKSSTRTCPLAFNPLLYAALTSPAPHLPTDATAAASTSHPDRPVQASGLKAAFKSSTPAKVQQKLLEMEDDVVDQVRSVMQLTSERVSASLAVVTEECQESPPHLTKKAAEPECGQEFCRLGCVCVSLRYPAVSRHHCQRPDCMFECGCNQTPQDERKPRSFKLWNRNIFDKDPDPVFVAKTESVPPEQSSRSHPASLKQQMKEEDKDPVYKYLESFMTCARVRAFNSKQSSQCASEPSDVPVPNNDNQDQDQPAASQVKQVKKQIEIQSVCRWGADRETVLETLCKHLNQDNMKEPFSIGPYYIRPITKIFINKPNGSRLTYRVRISRPGRVSVGKEEPSPIGVKHFLGGVLPAGLMVARTKPVSRQSSELIKVNGKIYNHVNLLLGSMGSLHPANRLAAYATGRLQPRTDLVRRADRVAGAPAARKVDAKPAAAIACKVDPKPVHLNFKPTGTLLPLVVLPGNCTDFKTYPFFQLLKQQSENTETKSPTLGQPIPVAPANLFQRMPRSPVSLTVSPSLKTPSFLHQQGTYSFRICPPSGPSQKEKKRASIGLPGGFTLLQIPKTQPPKESQSDAPQEVTSDVKVPVAVNETSMMKDEHLISSSEDSYSSYADSSGDRDSDADGLVDVESIDQAKQEMAIANLKELAQNITAGKSTEVVRDMRKRKDHSVMEKQRRFEHRTLFDELQNVLGEQGGSRLHVLSMALKEIQTQRALAKELWERKKELMQIQALHLKKLSRLSGMPEELIKRNLNTVFSGLKDKVGSNAEPAVTCRYQSDDQPTDDSTEPPTRVPIPAPAPPPPPSKPSPPVLPPERSELPAVQKPQPEAPPSRPPQASHDEPTISPPPLNPRPRTRQVAPAPPSKMMVRQPTQQFTIPLVRSKTGRLILPSSMRPASVPLIQSSQLIRHKRHH
ncbi:MAX gene-associated protein isoform X2 [Syngnathoides biaculeatus]|uniref:MAX gene-associated protein isoform X2 n=1 Tax=Syngnathoides biaculeatus TaxID=300417 RepID=UPI002ADD5CA7|nr:MAX gene-associated protein isoform X2 [Syngnathoides biaculeatus]